MVNEIVVLVDTFVGSHDADNNVSGWHAREFFVVDLVRILRQPVTGEHEGVVWFLL